MLTAWINKIKSLARTAKCDEQGTLRLTARQIYILPTPYGCFYAILVLAMWLGANNYASNFGFILVYLLAGVGMSIMLQTWKNLLGLEIKAGQCDNAFADGHSTAWLHLHNRYSTPRAAIQCQFNADSNALDLAANQQHALACPINAGRRGVLKINRIKLFSRYPGGLFYAWSYLNTEQSCLVYPKPRPAKMNLPTDAHQDFDTPTLKQTQTRDKPNDFKGHRHFQAGDNMKHIDWKAYARKASAASPTLLKEFSDAPASAVWISWQETDRKDDEAILSALCARVLSCVRKAQPYGLILPNLTLKPNLGAAHQAACLAALARYGIDDARDE